MPDWPARYQAMADQHFLVKWNSGSREVQTGGDWRAGFRTIQASGPPVTAPSAAPPRNIHPKERSSRQTLASSTGLLNPSAADPAAFRRLFKRITRLTPSAYRRKFQLPDFARPVPP